MRRQFFFTALLALVGLVVAAPESQAQDQTVAWVYQMTPRVGHQGPFLESFAQHAEWRRQQNDPWSWQVFEVVAGNDLGDFIVRSGGHSWADLDAYDAGFGPMGGENFGELVLPHVESVSGQITMTDTETVHWPDEDPGFTLFQVVQYHVKPEMMQQFNQTINRFHDALMEHNFSGYYSFASSVAGGDGSVVSLVLPFTNWEAMAPPQPSMEEIVVQAVGEAQAMQLFEDFTESFSSASSWVLRLRPDLSVPGGM